LLELNEQGENKVQKALTSLTSKKIGEGNAFQDSKEAYRIGE